MISGWCSHSATFSDTEPRTLQASIASIIRHQPARLP